MNVTVIGTGYVGLIAGICFAEFGHDVVCLDTDNTKIEKLKNGICPIYEPGAEEIIRRNQKTNRLVFTTNVPAAIAHGEAVFITVGTPEMEDGNADLSYFYTAAEMIAQHMMQPVVVVDKSTVPVGTSKEIAAIISAALAKRGVSIPFDVVSNPEFLREGKAVSDFMNPDRIVIGADNEKAAAVMKRLYAAFERSNKPILVTTPETAEMIKYASNAFLATKISFINEIANLCEATGANVRHVAKAMGLDGRISPKFLHAGPGYGGSCFPKDTKALAKTGEKFGVPMQVVTSAIAANDTQKQRAAEKIIRNSAGISTLAVLGLAFKPETDDIREAPALAIIERLVKDTALTLRVYDPQAAENTKKELAHLPDGRVVFCDSTEECLQGAQAVAIVTEWLEFRGINFVEYAEIQKIFDLRNTLVKADILSMNKEYFGTGI